MLHFTNHCAIIFLLTCHVAFASTDGSTWYSLESLREQERTLIAVIKKCSAAFVFIDGGSGFLISKEGHILTNEHVVAGQPDKDVVVVTLTGGKRLVADILGHDPGGDLALLKLQEPIALEDGIEPLRLGDSDSLKVGQTVFALGDPFLLASAELFIRGWPPSYEPSVSVGIVSALHRFSETYFDAIQVDVAINRGNSGGPLLTLDGEVVGINGKIETRLEIGINTGVGYAIPSNQVKRFLEPLKNAHGGIVQHGSVRGLEVAERADQSGGLPIVSVRKGSLEERIGFHSGDRILAINGFKVPTRSRYLGVLGAYLAGDELQLELARGSETLTLAAPLVEAGGASLGVKASGDVGGVRVTTVFPGRAAHRGGLRENDLIEAVDGEKIRLVSDLQTLVKTRQPGEKVRMALVRGDMKVWLDLRLGGDGGEDS